MDELNSTREIWKLFNLNNSKGAAMEYRVNGEVVKKHGYVPNTDNMKEMHWTDVPTKGKK